MNTAPLVIGDKTFNSYVDFHQWVNGLTADERKTLGTKLLSGNTDEMYLALVLQRWDNPLQGITPYIGGERYNVLFDSILDNKEVSK